MPKIAAVFLDRDGVINEEIGHISSPEQICLIKGVESAIKKFNEAGIKVIVITNQPCVARNLCSEKELIEINDHVRTLIAKKGGVIDDIYYCPHHPDKGYPDENSIYKTKCECRKPNIGLLKKAFSDHNLKPENAIFIGDSTTDIQTAKNAGIISIIVKTGFAGEDGKYPVMPDFIMDDLQKVAILLETYNAFVSSMKIGIIAGGKGKRLHELTLDKIPKVLLPLGGKTIIASQIECFKQQGFTNFIFSLGHMSNMILEYLKKNNNFDVNIDSVVETMPIGTGGAINQCINTMKNSGVILYGDLAVKINLKKAILFHLIKNSKLTLAIHESSHPEDSDVIEINSDDSVKNIIHKPGNKKFGNLTNAGIYIFDYLFLSQKITTGCFAFDRDFLPSLISTGKIFAYYTEDLIFDVGTPERYSMMEQIWKNDNNTNAT